MLKASNSGTLVATQTFQRSPCSECTVTAGTIPSSVFVPIDQSGWGDTGINLASTFTASAGCPSDATEVQRMDVGATTYYGYSDFFKNETTLKVSTANAVSSQTAKFRVKGVDYSLTFEIGNCGVLLSQTALVVNLQRQASGTTPSYFAPLANKASEYINVQTGCTSPLTYVFEKLDTDGSTWVDVSSQISNDVISVSTADIGTTKYKLSVQEYSLSQEFTVNVDCTMTLSSNTQAPTTWTLNW